MAGAMSVDGDEQLRSSLSALAAELRHLDATDDKAGEQLASRVVAEAPKLTGYMAGTVEHAGATITVGAPYAGFVDARNPFAERAMAAEQQDIVNLYAEDIAAAVARTVG